MPMRWRLLNITTTNKDLLPVSPERPQYYDFYGNGLGDANFVEDYDDLEFLSDEALAREGLYRGMSSVIYIILHVLIWRRQLQESVVLLHSGTVDYDYLFRCGSYTSVYNTFTLTVTLSFFPHSQKPNYNRTLVIILPSQRLFCTQWHWHSSSYLSYHQPAE